MFDIYQNLGDEDGEHDEAVVEQYTQELMAEFDQSPEALSIPARDGNRGSWVGTLAHYYFNYSGSNFAKMSAAVFDEIVFSIFPRKVSMEAQEAGECIDELRAFWQFAHRQYGLPNAHAILAKLDDTATARLHIALSNPSNFGLAKSFFMMGQQAGYDMTTEQGLAAFQMVYNAQLASNRDSANTVPILLPGFGHELPLPPERDWDAIRKNRKEKKKKREAKKRNRR